MLRRSPTAPAVQPRASCLRVWLFACVSVASLLPGCVGQEVPPSASMYIYAGGLFKGHRHYKKGGVELEGCGDAFRTAVTGVSEAEAEVDRCTTDKAVSMVALGGMLLLPIAGGVVTSAVPNNGPVGTVASVAGIAPGVASLATAIATMLAGYEHEARAVTIYNALRPRNPGGASE